MSRQRAVRTWISCLVLGATGGVLTLVFPSVGWLLVLAGAAPAAVSATRAAAVGGLLTGLGGSWLVVFARAEERCRAFNRFPGQECIAPDLRPWLTAAGAMLVAGALLSLRALVGGRRP